MGLANMNQLLCSINNIVAVVVVLLLLLICPQTAHVDLNAASSGAAPASSDVQVINVNYSNPNTIDVGTVNVGTVNVRINVYNISVSRPKRIMLDTVIYVAGGGYFLPILSSPSFNSSINSFGSSFGFYVISTSDVSALGPYTIYLAVCAGRSDNYSSNPTLLRQELPWMQGSNDSYKFADGYVVPVTIITRDRPLSFDKFFKISSLVLEDGSNELKLRDSDGSTVWNVSNISAMEMQDEGTLVMYDSVSKSKVIWRSNMEPSDTLLQGQKLKPGMKLKSNDSAYRAQMENGGLVLYYDKVIFADQNPPYWVFPVLFNESVQTDFASLNKLVLSAPCSNRADNPAYAMLGNSSWDLFLHSGCNDLDSSISTSNDTSHSPSWSFLRLENDGRLYIYGVINPATPGGMPSLEKYALDSKGAMLQYSTAPDESPFPAVTKDLVSNLMPFFAWGKCDVPMACGPLGICTPDAAANPCTCPQFFDPHDRLNPSQGCQYQPTSVVPPCQHSDNEHIKYLQLNATASIFLFSGWTFDASTSTSVQTCQMSCSLNCSCTGFFHQANSLSCFFITDKAVSFLSVSSTHLNQVSNVLAAEEYVTYLKVASQLGGDLNINATSGSNETSGRNETSGSKQSVDSKEAIHNQGNQANVFFIVVLSVVPAVAACLVVILTVYCCLVRARKQRLRKMSEQLNEEDLKDILPLLPTRFSYKDLRDATGGFSKLLGTGGYGSVYAGVLPDGRKVAVKMLDLLLKGQSQQFLAEVATIGRTNHVNIVCLVGFCWEVSHRLLVYEYVERGSLDNWLFSDADTLSGNGVINDGAIIQAPLLDWQTRYNLALGIARGLSYLHEDCTQPILHFDIKPQNILLDNAFVAKIADFGMSKLMQRGISKVVTGVRGTPGYIAPEWLSRGAVSKKTDVYSMGMVMLEIVGGRRNLELAMLNITSTPDLAQHEVCYFPSWAAEKCKQGLMMEIVDKRLQVRGFDEEQVRTLIYTTFWCIQEDPELRPYASTVVQWLEGKSPVRQPPFSTQPASNAKSRSPRLVSNSVL